MSRTIRIWGWINKEQVHRDWSHAQIEQKMKEVQKEKQYGWKYGFSFHDKKLNETLKRKIWPSKLHGHCTLDRAHPPPSCRATAIWQLTFNHQVPKEFHYSLATLWKKAESTKEACNWISSPLTTVPLLLKQFSSVFHP